jgi:hypothetical protein
MHRARRRRARGGVARLARAVDAPAQTVVETAEDVAELQAARRATDHQPPTGAAALKETTAYADGFSTETVRLSAAAGAIKAQRRGG